MKKKSLYECSNARVAGDRVYCRRGHILSDKSDDGRLDARRLARGEPLVLDLCQTCPNFDRNGPPLPDSEKGWIKPGKKAKARR